MKTKAETEKLIRRTFRLLYDKFGPQHWWPGETPFEVMVGAVLTQQTAWKNVEKAIQNLKNKGVLAAEKIYEMKCEELAKLIKPAGFYNLKARRLKEFVEFFIATYGASIERMKRENLHKLREKFLSVSGIGRETADSILLYALDKPVFVVDAYTRRIYSRLGVISGKKDYDEIRMLFEKSLSDEEFVRFVKNNFKFPGDATVYIFQEMHALIVKEGKDYCRKKPVCAGCPFENICISKGGEIQ